MRQLPLGQLPLGRAPAASGGADGGGTSPEDEPACMAVTEYHYILLHPDRLMAVSGKVVAEVALGPSGASGVIGAPLTLLQDGGGGGGAGPYLVTSDALLEVGLLNEGRGMWRTYLEYEDYDSALKLAAGPAQRDTVYLAMARDSFARGDYKAAASQWARVVGGRPSFEDVALQLVEAGDPGALALFLSTKLQ
ncbi:Pep3/Vps18/deep orange family protein, partial [Monoraphidium neglectum]